jgi:uncharacterized membrane protein
MDVLYQYFLSPVMRNGWFNPLNSLVYGLVLIAGGWLVFKLLLKLHVKIDGKFFLSLIPFIAFAGVTRTLRDFIYSMSAGSATFLATFTEHMRILQQNAYNYVFSVTGNHALASADSYIIAWFPTPGSYIITFLLALVSLFISLSIQKYLKIPYWKTMFTIGFVIFLANAALLPVNSYTPLLYIGLVSLGWTMPP